MALNPLVLTRNYAALQIYRQNQIDLPYDELEASYTITNDNLTQIATDTFGGTYEYTNDGVPQFVTPLIDRVALLSDNETITGSWTFDDTVQFNQTVNFAAITNNSAQPRVKAFRNASNQIIPDNIATDADLNGEVYDIGSMHDIGLQTQRILIPSGGSGSYIFSAQVTFEANNTGRREISVEKNGTPFARAKEFNPDATEETVLQLTFQDQPGVADNFDLVVYQNSGGDLDVIANEEVTYFTAMKVW